MKRPVLKISLLSLLLLITLFYALLASRTGLRLAYRVALNYIPGDFSVAQLDGSLLGPITITDLHYRNDQSDIRLQHLQLTWHWQALFNDTLHVEQLDAAGLTISYSPLQTNESTSKSDSPAISLPMNLVIADCNLKDVRYRQDDTEIFLPHIQLDAADQLVNLETHVRYQHPSLDQPLQADVSLHLRYQTDGIRFSRVIVDTLGGQIQASGNIGFSPSLTWQADIRASHLHSITLDERIPDDLSAHFSLQGEQTDAGPSQHIQLTELSGRLHDYPVTAQGEFSHRGTSFDITNLNLGSGQTHASLKGHIGEQWDTQWSFDSPDLSQLLPDASGKLSAQGHLSGNLYQPVIQATIDASNLAAMDARLASLRGNISIDTLTDGEWHARLQAQDLQWQDTLHVQQASATLTGNRSAHRLTLAANQDNNQLKLELDGRYADEQWHGTLQRANVENNTIGQWQLLQPVSGILISAEQNLLPQNCWQQSSARLCLSATQSRQQGWSAQFKGTALPLRYAQTWLPDTLALDGTTDIMANVSAPAQSVRPTRGKLTLTLPPGQLHFGEQLADTLHYEGGELQLSLQDEQLDASTTLTLEKQVQIAGQLRVTQLYSAAPALSGKLHGQLTELGPIEDFIPEIDQLSGGLDANLKLSGSLVAPRLTGTLGLHEARLLVPRTGVSYQHINIKLVTDKQQNLRIHGSAQSGDSGTIDLNGKLVLQEATGWQLELHTSGEQFLISDTLETRVRVSPKLDIQLQPYDIHLSGTLHVPQATLLPKDFQGAITPSRDAEILSEQPTSPTSRWNIYSNVTLTLGENVYFNGYGLRGFFGGKLALLDSPGQLTTGKGELSIRDGRYRAYGQDLTIETGRLLFNDSPLNSPGLDIRAVRTVNAVKAGILVAGSLQTPRISLFSEPPMTESDILAYLLFGRPMNQTSKTEEASMAEAASAIGLAGGGLFAARIGEQLGLDEVSMESGETLQDTALQIGKYLSPSLYLGYSVGLFEPINSLLLRYRINDNWSIETETGTESGGDILFTIDR